jgi:hypothetical protein
MSRKPPGLFMVLTFVTLSGAIASASTITTESTGQNVTAGQDNSFQITSDTTGELTAPAQAFVITTPPPQWAAPIAGTEWIGPSANQAIAGQCCTNSSDTYQTLFSLAGLDPSTATLGLSMLVDNDITVMLNGKTVYTNGAPLSSTTYMTPFSVTLNSGFIGGTNTLDFIVGNGFGATGVDASINGTASPIGATVPEPSALGLCCIGLAALAGRVRTQRRA